MMGLYIVAPDRQERLFSITALTEAEWQAVQNETHGEALLNYGGIVWVYNPASDGSPFELGPCCGADPATSPPQTEFVFTVEWQDGLFKVLELPVYLP